MEGVSNEVAVCAVRSLVALAEHRGLGDILEGGGLTEADLTERRRVDWDMYVPLVDRFVVRAGGLDVATRLATDIHLGGGVLDWVLSSRFAPRRLYAQACALAPRAWRNLEVTLTPDGEALRIQARLTSGVGSEAFFHISRSTLESLPAHAGLGRATVVARVVTPMGATWRVSNPPNPNAEPDAASGSTLASRRRLDAQERAAQASEAWRLTPTETLVLVEIMQGASNKDVGLELGMAEATVETHLTRVFRKAGTQGRAAIISRVWSDAW